MVHFILVHGLCHGGWCWYKVKPVLESAGHRVTMVDLAASGKNMTKIDDVHTMGDYTEPLIELIESSVPPGEKVILVGHSLGGFNLALAMYRFPQKISATVFLAAYMPDSIHSPSYVLDQLRSRSSSQSESLLDIHFSSDDLDPANAKITMIFGRKFVASQLYQLSPPEDLALAEMLMRPGPSLHVDLSKRKAFSEVGYLSVNRVYIVCKKDVTLTEDFQSWMIENNQVKEVMEIEGADHMAMLSKPNEVCCCLLDIGATKYN
ncbi:hypothetical protein NE237_018631 [Protea cynaroides]|uniref:AB hydrolase-1 domain-containing protein n=1 Tax=Protea cynaroides TaxID=273540 RepID=A0A9Q0KA98_9MAGN|nr:hypothetical protein NE237_018631 [Protea cynaroides]